MTERKSLIESLRQETTVLRHVFRREPMKGRPDIIQHVHDVEKCVLCGLIDVARAAQTQTQTLTNGTKATNLGQALSELEARGE